MKVKFKAFEDVSENEKDGFKFRYYFQIENEEKYRYIDCSSTKVDMNVWYIYEDINKAIKDLSQKIFTSVIQIMKFHYFRYHEVLSYKELKEGSGRDFQIKDEMTDWRGYEIDFS